MLPLFGLDSNNKLTVQGLHVGSDKCTLSGSILFDVKNKLIGY